MSVRDDNINFLSGILSIQNPPEVIDINFTYGLWTSVFKHVGLNADGYDFPSWLVEDIIAFEKPITGTCWTEENSDGKYAKSRFFITKGVMGTDTYESLEAVADITDSHVTATAPLIVMPGVASPGKMYRRCEITGVVKPRFLNTEVLVVSGEDWVFVKPVTGDNLDPNYSYLYVDSGYSGYSNEVITRYKFLYDDPTFSTAKDLVSFDSPIRLGDNLDLKYRVSRKSDPFGSFSHVDVSDDGTVLIDLKEHKHEKSEHVMSSVAYNFSGIGAVVFSPDQISGILIPGNLLETTGKFNIPFESITGVVIKGQSDDRPNPSYSLLTQLMTTGNYSGVYKVDFERNDFESVTLISRFGYVMSGYNASGIGNKTINVASGSGVYARLTSDEIDLTYSNFITNEEAKEDLGLEEEGISVTSEVDLEKFGDDLKKIYAATINELNDLSEEELLSSPNNISETSSIKIFLQDFPLPKKIIPQDYYSNHLNSGESYIVLPVESYSSLITIPCGNELVTLYRDIRGEQSRLINSTCAGLRIGEVSFCKGDTAIEYLNKADKGSVTRIPSDGVIKKSNYTAEQSWLNAINYFYTKNYVSSAVLTEALTDEGYRDFFSNVLSGVKDLIGGPSNENSNENSFFKNGGSAPRIFVEREIYTEPYNQNQISEFNRSFNSGSAISSDNKLIIGSDERLYCVQTYSTDAVIKSFTDDFYPIENHDEQLSFTGFIENVEFNSVVSKLSFEFNKEPVTKYMFRPEYATGIAGDFTSGNYAGSKVWSGPQNTLIIIPNENIKNYAYHLYTHTNDAPTLVFNKSNVTSNDPTPSTNNLDIFVVLKFTKKNFNTASWNDGTQLYELSANAPSNFFRFNIQVYDYSSIERSEHHQWLIFNKNPINNNTYVNEDPAYDVGNINFFEESDRETINEISVFTRFPNGPSTSKNHEGTPIDSDHIASLDDGLFKNKIIVIEESKVKLEYNSNCVLDFVDNQASITKHSVPNVFEDVLFSNKRRAKITKVKYNFYTKSLVIIGDAGSPGSTDFNDGWEYELQYRKTNDSVWKKVTESTVFTKEEIASHSGRIDPFYFTSQGNKSHYLSMMAFEVNLPLFLDDNNYEFKIVKYQRLATPSFPVDVVKKTNFIPVQVSWSGNAACSRFNIYQRDSGNNLKLLGTESLLKTYSYVVPDVRQSYVDSGLANFGASNYSGYYDIVVSGIIPLISQSSTSLSGVYGFDVGDLYDGSDEELEVNVAQKLNEVVEAIVVSGVTYSPMLNFNNPESKNSDFEINQNHNGYYFVTNSATGTLNGITGQVFEAYVANTGSLSCSVGGTGLNSSYVAAVSGTLPIVTSGLQVLGSASLSLNDISNNNLIDVIYLKNDFTLANPTDGKKFYLINDSASIVTGSYSGSNYSFAGGKTFRMDSAASALTTDLTLSNVDIQDDYIYSNTGLVNFDHSKLTLSSAVPSLPVYNASKNKLTVNDSLVLDAGSFNFVTWNGANAPSGDLKNYFDVIRMYLHVDDSSQSVTLLKDDTEIVITNSFGNAIKEGDEMVYYFLKDERVKRNLNVKIITINSNNQAISTIEIPSDEQDFKMTVFKHGKFELLQASLNPVFETTKAKDQVVILKGDLAQEIHLKNLKSSFRTSDFLYFINEGSNDAKFIKGVDLDNLLISVSLLQGGIARVYKTSSDEIEIDILGEDEDTKNHFEFNIVSGEHLKSPINILNLDFCGTEINFPSFENFTGKNTLLICKNRLIPNTLDDFQGGVRRALGVNSIFLNVSAELTAQSNYTVYTSDYSILNPASERPFVKVWDGITSAQTPSLIPFSEETPGGEVYHYFYINDTGLSNFTLRDFYNRKSKYAGKIFLPTNRELKIHSFDEKNNFSEVSPSFSFDYSPDGYANGRLEVEKISTDVVLSYESEKGSTEIEFSRDTVHPEGSIYANFAYDTAIVTLPADDASGASATLKKNRLAVQRQGSLKVFPIYNRSEFFIEGDINYDRYYVISTDVDSIDIDSIIIPDTYAAKGLIIKNTSSRSYPIKTLSGSAITVILPNQQIKLLYNTPWGFAGHTDAGYTEDGFKIVWIVIKFSNQWVETSSTHPLKSIYPTDSNDANIFLNNFINTTLSADGFRIKFPGNIKFLGNNPYPNSEIVDVDPGSVMNESGDLGIYCYGRSLKRELTEEQKNNHVTLVNAFYLRLESGGGIIEKNEFTNSGGLRFPLTVIERKHVDLWRSFDYDFLNSSKNVIFIPITSHLVTYYLPNLSLPVKGLEPEQTLAARITLNSKVVFVNLIRCSLDAPNQVVNYSDASTQNLININQVLVYQMSGEAWVKIEQQSHNVKVKTVYPTLKGVKGITATSTPEGADGTELVYLSNFNKFYVGLDSFKNRQYEDFYVYNSCDRSISIAQVDPSDSTPLVTSKFLKISKNAHNKFFSITNIKAATPSSFSSVFGKWDTELKLQSGSIAKSTIISQEDDGEDGFIEETKMTVYKYNLSREPEKIDVDGKSVLDLTDLKEYASSDKLFIFGSSAAGAQQVSVDSYDLQLNRLPTDDGYKFYVFNATTKNLKIKLQSVQQVQIESLYVPALRMIEISTAGIRYMESHSKGAFYINGKISNKNYLLKSDIPIFLDNLTNFKFKDSLFSKDTNEENLMNIAISSLKNNSRESVVYKYNTDTPPAQNNYWIDNKKYFLGIKEEGFTIIQPAKNIISPGHYIVNDNVSDIIVASGAVSASSVFLVNNCTKDISAFVFVGDKRTEKTLFRNTVLVVTAGGQTRYLKKSKQREEFYSVFNLKTQASLEIEQAITKLFVMRTKDIWPIFGLNRSLQDSYIKLLSKSGVVGLTRLSLRGYYNGADIPTDSPVDVLAYEIGIGHETIYKFLFFDPSESTYTLPGIENGAVYVVDIDLNLFFNLREIKGLYSDAAEQDPYVKYNGKKYTNGQSFTGTKVSNYEVKYPNYVKVAKSTQDLEKTFDNQEDEQSEEQIDSPPEFEIIPIDAKSEFKEKILTDIADTLKKDARFWIPTSEIAFWQDPSSQKEHWIITEVYASDTKTITSQDGTQYVSFVKCSLQKSNFKTTGHRREYFSALQFKHAVASYKDLIIGVNLNELDDNQEKAFKDAQQIVYENVSDFIVPPVGLNSLIPLTIPGGTPDYVLGSPNIEVSVALSKLATMPNVEFEDFSESEIIKLLN